MNLKHIFAASAVALASLPAAASFSCGSFSATLDTDPISFGTALSPQNCVGLTGDPTTTVAAANAAYFAITGNSGTYTSENKDDLPIGEGSNSPLFSVLQTGNTQITFEFATGFLANSLIGLKFGGAGVNSVGYFLIADAIGAGSTLIFNWSPEFQGDGLSHASVFGATAPIPEPETYALMLAGLGAVGFMARRRKLAQKV